MKIVTIVLPDDMAVWFERRRHGNTLEDTTLEALRMYKDERERVSKRWHERIKDPVFREKERERIREASRRYRSIKRGDDAAQH